MEERNVEWTGGGLDSKVPPVCTETVVKSQTNEQARARYMEKLRERNEQTPHESAQANRHTARIRPQIKEKTDERAHSPL